MGFESDDRGVTVQIGAVLLFGTLIVALSIYQVTAVPTQNEQVEFQHSERVQSQMQDVRGAILRSGATGVSQSERVTLGPTYPGRTFFVNPPPPSGSLATVGTQNPDVRVTIENANATRAGDPETGDYWNGDPRQYETGGLTYRPDYNLYDTAPVTGYENTVVANFFDSGAVLPGSDQTVVDGRHLQVVTLGGDISASTVGSRSVTVHPVSTASRSVAVRNDDGQSIELRFATAIPESTWRNDLLADELDPDGSDPDAYVSAISSTSIPGTQYRELTLTLERGVTYDLTMTRVVVGDGADSGLPGAYVTAVDSPVSLPEGGVGELTVEVRDRYNNPVSGVDVTVQSVSTGTVSPSSALTGPDGRATFTYEAPNNVAGQQTATVTLSFGGNDNERERATFEVTVYNTGGGGGGGGSGGSGGGASGSQVRLVSGSVYAGGGGNSEVYFTMQNTGSSDVAVTGIAVNSTNASAQTISAGGKNTREFASTSSNKGLKSEIDIGRTSPYAIQNGQEPVIAGGGSTELVLRQFRDGGGNTVSTSGKRVTVTLYYGNGNHATYVLNVP
ncbi:MAG: Ig-like domain-containing protein [Haloferacaceae archaeon]